MVRRRRPLPPRRCRQELEAVEEGAAGPVPVARALRRIRRREIGVERNRSRLPIALDRPTGPRSASGSRRSAAASQFEQIQGVPVVERDRPEEPIHQKSSRTRLGVRIRRSTSRRMRSRTSGETRSSCSPRRYSVQARSMPVSAAKRSTIGSVTSGRPDAPFSGRRRGPGRPSTSPRRSPRRRPRFRRGSGPCPRDIPR